MRKATATTKRITASKELRKDEIGLFRTHAAHLRSTAVKVHATTAAKRRVLSTSFGHLIGRIDAVQSVLIVQFSLFRVREGRIGFADLLKVFRGFFVVGVLVGVPLESRE